MISASKTSECVLQVFFCCRTFNAENFVVVSFVCQRSTYSTPTGAPLKPHVGIMRRETFHTIDNIVRKEGSLNHMMDILPKSEQRIETADYPLTLRDLQWILFAELAQVLVLVVLMKLFLHHRSLMSWSRRHSCLLQGLLIL